MRKLSYHVYEMSRGRDAIEAFVGMNTDPRRNARRERTTMSSKRTRKPRPLDGKKQRTRP